MTKISSQDYCKNFVRNADYNLYLLHFFVPRANRRALLSIMALHCELRAIPQKVHDPMMRLIRLKWWHDEIKKFALAKGFADSPILNEIHANALYDLNWDEYFTRFETSLRGEENDLDESLYALFGQTLSNKSDVSRFSKKLALHDQLGDSQKFRALRLWLGV